MRAVLLAAGSAAVMIGLGVLPSLAADMPPPPPVAEYDEPEPIEPVVEAPLVEVAPVPPEPVIGPWAYVFEGDNYCWFDGGWRGPGWYVCDYGPWMTGSWWGGPAGWNGWAWGGGQRYYNGSYGAPPRAGIGRPYGGPPGAGIGGPYGPPRAGFGRSYAAPGAVFNGPHPRAGFAPRSSYARDGYGGGPRGGYGGGHYGGHGPGGGGYR